MYVLCKVARFNFIRLIRRKSQFMYELYMVNLINFQVKDDSLTRTVKTASCYTIILLLIPLILRMFVLSQVICV